MLPPVRLKFNTIHPNSEGFALPENRKFANFSVGEQLYRAVKIDFKFCKPPIHLHHLINGILIYYTNNRKTLQYLEALTYGILENFAIIKL